MSEQLTKKAATHAGYVVTRGALGVCEHCSVAKAKRKDLGSGEDEAAGDKIYLDCATVKVNGKRLGKAVWRLMTKKKSGFTNSQFFDSKDGMVEPTIQKLHQYKEHVHYAKS